MLLAHYLRLQKKTKYEVQTFFIISIRLSFTWNLVRNKINKAIAKKANKPKMAFKLYLILNFKCFNCKTIVF